MLPAKAPVHVHDLATAVRLAVQTLSCQQRRKVVLVRVAVPPPVPSQGHYFRSGSLRTAKAGDPAGSWGLISLSFSQGKAATQKFSSGCIRHSHHCLAHADQGTCDF